MAEHGKRKNPEIAPNKNCKNSGEGMIVTGNRKEVKKKIGCKIIRGGARTQLQFYFFSMFMCVCVQVAPSCVRAYVCVCVGGRSWSTDNFSAFTSAAPSIFPMYFSQSFRYARQQIYWTMKCLCTCPGRRIETDKRCPGHGEYSGPDRILLWSLPTKGEAERAIFVGGRAAVTL